MNLSLVNTTESQVKQIAEVNKNICVTNGYDRIKFVNPSTGISGDLGIKLLKDYWYAPIFNSEGVGLISTSGYIALRLVPISTYITDSNTGEYLQGAAMHWSDPVQPSGSLKSLIFDIPEIDNQDLVFFAGFATGGNPTTVQDTTRLFADDTLIGFQVRNIENGLIATITANISTEMTIDADISIQNGDRYHIIKPLITGYKVYAALMADPSQVQGAQFVYQESIDIESTTYELSSIVTAGIPLLDVYYPPEPYSACLSTDNKLFAAGGVYDTTGQAEIDNNQVEYLHAGSLVVTTTMSYAQVIGTSASYDKIMRYTLPAGSENLTMRKGTIVTIINSEDAGNDVAEAIITNHASDGSWFEIINSTGVDNADDTTMDILFTRNVLVGNTGGVGQTKFTEGMVGSRFKFSDDMDSYQIAWVDEVNQEIGLYTKYVGLNTGTGRYEIRPLIAPDLPHTSAVIAKVLWGEGVANVAGGDFSICFWRKRTAYATSIEYLIKFGKISAAADYLTLYHNHGSLKYIMAYNPATQTHEFASAIPDTDWHHYTITVATGAVKRIRLYVDGVEVTRTFSNGTPNAWTAIEGDIDVLLNYDGLSSYFAKLRIFNVLLSDDDVVSVYNDGLVSGEIRRWVMNENSGDVCAEYYGGVSLQYSEINTGALPPTAKTGMIWETFDYGYVPIENSTEFSIASNLGVGWSDSGNPHVFRTENYTEVSDVVNAMAAFNQNLLLFCDNSLQRIPLQGLGEYPTLMSDDVKCVAPMSVVETPVGVFFYDGSGISMTDGQTIIPVTSYRANSYLKEINNNYASNMRGVYEPNKRRVEFVFAYADSTFNNFGISISIDSLNCYPFQRIDCNAMWLDRIGNGDLAVFHGTTNSVGNGAVWSHDDSYETDGSYDQELVGNITGISGQVLTVDFGEAIDEAVTISAGDIALLMPSVSGNYRQFKIVSYEANGDAYDFTIDSAEDLTDVAIGDTLIIGGIPFDYGVKWTDFSSPRHKHKVRQLQIDVTDFNGVLYVQHYGNMINSPICMTSHLVTSSSTKIFSKTIQGDCYTYGFRIFGVSITRFAFHSFEILFETEA